MSAARHTGSTGKNNTTDARSGAGAEQGAPGGADTGIGRRSSGGSDTDLGLRARLPFHPKKFPVFYGWVVLVVGTMGMLMSVPGQTVGVSVFTDFLIEALDLQRSTLSIAYLGGTVLSAFLLRRGGKVYDRYGARISGISVTVLLGLTLLYLSVSDRISGGIVEALAPGLSGTALPVIVAFIVVTIGFFMLRFFGQGTLTLISRNMVLKWFEKRRGIANAVLGASISLGFSAAPRLLDELVGSFGWREAWRFLALVLFGFAVLVWILYRDSPRIFGLEPDGGAVGTARTPHPDTVAARDFTLGEARRTYAFWIFTLTVSFSALLVTAFTFHVVSIFQTSGLSREAAVNVFLPSAVVAVTIQIGGSWLSDHVRFKWFATVHLLGQILLSVGIVLLGGDSASTLLAVLGLGISQGMMGITGNVTWPRYFGLAHLGEISGFAMAWTVAGSAVGPYIFSLSLDLFGSYESAAFLILAVNIVLLFGSLWTKRPE